MDKKQKLENLYKEERRMKTRKFLKLVKKNYPDYTFRSKNKELYYKKPNGNNIWLFGGHLGENETESYWIAGLKKKEVIKNEKTQ